MRRAAALASIGLLWASGAAFGQGAQVTPSQQRVIVMAGQTSSPITLQVAEPAPVRDARSYVFVVQIPTALMGQVAAIPTGISIAIAPGGSLGQGTFQFLTQPGAPVGTWNITFFAPDGGLTGRMELEIQPAQGGRGGADPPPGRRPPGGEQPPAGEFRVGLLPPRLAVCAEGDAARGTLELQAIGGYRGTPTVRWGPLNGLSVATTGPPNQPLPPDRRVPFEVTARGAPPGRQVLTVVVSDPVRDMEVQAQAQVAVEAGDFVPHAVPTSLSVRQGGPPATVTVSVDANECLGRNPIRAAVIETPAGIEASPPMILLPAPTSQASFQVAAAPSAATGRHAFRIDFVDESAGGRLRRVLDIPLVVERPGPAELAAAPRIDRVEPARLTRGERATIELTGDNLGPDVSISFEPDDLRVLRPPIFHSRTRVTVEVEVRAGARLGPRLAVTSGRQGRFEGPGLLRIEAGRLAGAEPQAAPEDEPPGPPGDVARLDFGGFIVEVTSVSDPSLDNFAGQGALEEFVFAGRLQTLPMTVAFEDLSLEATATAGLYDVVAGEAIRDQAANLSLPIELTGMGVQLHRMVLSAGGALIDGKVFLPFVEGGPATGLVFGGAGGDTEPIPDGFDVIPAYQFGGGGEGGTLALAGGGGEAVLAYQGAPVTGGGFTGALLGEIAAGDGGAGGGMGPIGFDVQANPGAPENSVIFSDRPLEPDGDFIIQGLAEIDSHAIGQTGIAFEAQSGLAVLIDLSRGENQNQQAIDYAYRAWDVPEDVEEEAAGFGIGMNYANEPTIPAVPYDSPQWMGLLFLDAGLNAAGIGLPHASTDVAWVANGFQALVAKRLGESTETVMAHGWEVELLNAVLGIKNSVLIDAGSLGDIHLPLFDEKIRVLLKMTNGGSTYMEALSSVAHVYGHTAVIGEGAGFFKPAGSNELKLGFTDAKWAFNGDLDNPQPPTNPGGIEGALVANVGAQTTIEFLKTNYARKFHLKYLTLEADGDADLLGATRRSLASVPSLDFLDYPFLDGGAWILLEQQGSSYVLGLEGNLELAANLGGVSAAMHYTVQNGEEQQWTFEGELDADVNVVHLALDVEGEVDLATRDLSFSATGAFDIQPWFEAEAAGAFGREGSTRYWYVYAALDLGQTPIDLGSVAFHAFKGGVAHHLDVGESGSCSILDPIAFAGNADQCVDAGTNWTFLAGTVVAPSQGYGGAETLHVDGTLVISSEGSVDILGEGWVLRPINEGYGAGAPPQAAAHIGVNAERFVVTACVGPTGDSQGAPESAQTISCAGLQPLKFPKALPVVEIKGWTGLLADWTTNTYYLAVGHYSNRVQAKFFNLAWRQGYLVIAYSPSVPAHWLPPLAGGQVGYYAGRAAGYSWDFEHTWGLVCNNKVWANASLGSESNFFLELVPFALYADVHYWVSMGVGAEICGIGGGVQVAGDLNASVYVSQALGELSGGFSGEVLVCGANSCLKLVNIPNVNVNLTLWQS